MAFLGKFGSILKQAANKRITAHVSASRPSIYQAIRCMSSSKVFVGGTSYSTDDYGLKEAFDKYGQVLEARIIVDRETGRSRGFGFVTFSSSEEASVAIQGLDGQELHGRRVRVAYATERGPGFGGRGVGGGGGGGGYGAPAGNYGGNPYGGGGFGGGDGGYGAPAGNYGGNPYGGGGFGGGAGSNQYGGGNTYGSGGGYGGGNAYGSGGGGGGSGNAFGSGGSDYGAAGDSGGTDTFAQGDTSGGLDSKFDGADQTGGDFGNTSDQFGDINEFGDIEGVDKDERQGGFDGDDDDNSGVAKSA